LFESTHPNIPDLFLFAAFQQRAYLCTINFNSFMFYKKLQVYEINKIT